MIKRVARVIGNILTVVIIVIIAMSLYSMLQHRRNPEVVPSVFGYSAMSVLSGSMRPYLEPGDMIVDRAVKAKEIIVGDVITYRVGTSIVTHRVVEIMEKDNKVYFLTRGDANNTDDGRPIEEIQLIGRVSFKIPKGGYVARFIRSPIGILIIIGIPIMFMLAGELMKAILSGDKKKKTDKADT